MLTLHHLEYSQSFRTLWLLEELGADYELELYERDKKTLLAPTDYKALSPLGTAPVITDGEVVLAETGAISDYILDAHPKNTLRPKAGHADRTRYLFWFHAAQASLMPLMLIETLFRIMRTRVPFFLRPFVALITKAAQAGFIRPRLKALLDQAETDLSTAPWFGGDNFTAADIMISYPLESAQSRGLLTDAYPNCADWLERATARPAFLRAQEKDGRSSRILSL